MPGLEDAAGSFSSFSDLEGEVHAALNAFARQEAERGGDAAGFVAGAEQGLLLLDVLARRYDVVVANPPYVDSNNLSPMIADFLKKIYPDAKGDLYSSFIHRCVGLLSEDGRVGMITQQSFMFVPSYQKFRDGLRTSTAIEALSHLGPRAFSEISGEKVNTVLFVLRRDAHTTSREDSVGIYTRLVREPHAEAKRARFEKVIEALRSGKTESLVYYYPQRNFNSIPNSPWVYRVTPHLQTLFQDFRLLKDLAQVRQGLATADNFRFIRYWWEIRFLDIGRGYLSRDDAWASGKSWFTYVKEGGQHRWWRSQQAILNWHNDGEEIKAHVCHSYPYLDGKWEWVVKNVESYFLQGITYSAVSSKGFSARLMPAGFPFDHASNCVFVLKPEHINEVLGVLNSSFAAGILRLLNETINYYTSDLERIPVPSAFGSALGKTVSRAIELAKGDSVESETTYDFIAPPAWPTGSQDVAARHAELAAVEREIDEEVYRLYGIEGEDRRAIEEELSIAGSQLSVVGGSESVVGGSDEIDGDTEAEAEDDQQLTTNNQQATDKLAKRWVSYALGVALGRFQPGVDGAIGRGRFDAEVAAQLRALADADGLGMIEKDHPDDLCDRVQRVLDLMVGEDEAARLIDLATGGKPLAAYLTGDFYKEHTRQYRKRPVYWLIQSPRRTFSVMLFHERLTGDSLPLILGTRYLQGRINALHASLSEAQSAVTDAAPGRARKAAERARDEAAELLTDAEELARLIRAVLERPSERGEAVGWRPEIDDGVLINLAPLHTITPAWSPEPKKCWQALERGDYDWSHTAMRYWPDRVLTKCRTNKSYAIAHGVENP